MEVDMLLNMDGFDDNMTPAALFTSAGTAFAVSPAFSATDSVALSPRSDLHPAASYRRSQFCGSNRPWPLEANMYPYGLRGYPDYSTTDTLHDPGLAHSNQTSSIPDRPSMSTRPVARSREDNSWQMYLSASLSGSLHSLDLDIPNPCSLDPVYPQHELTYEHFSELESLESPTYPDTQTANDLQQIFCTTPLVAPQPTNIRPALLSFMPTQDTDNSLLLAQNDNSTKADDYTAYTSSIPDVVAPKFDICMAPSAPSSSPSHGRPPTITKLANYSSTRPRRGLSGWGTTNDLEPPAASSSTSLYRNKLPSSSTTSQSISPNPGLLLPDSISPPLSSSTGGSSRNSERLLKRLRQLDESPPNLKRASKTRRLMVADIDTEDEGVDIGGDSDSDDYTPSRSPSLNPSLSISPSSHSVTFQPKTSVISTSVKKKKTRKGKGKAKGSAALALAVVSQMIHNPSGARRDIDLTSTRYGVRRRKNHPIPLPIPVPNLNKKSRGRKVPYVANDTVMKTNLENASVKEEEDAEDDDESGEDRSRSSTGSRKKPTPSMSKSSSGENRSFVCVVAGCGKCFVRSEHLKRHVRSIHTHDKPHPCPFEGCDKSFSRRDNLGQHVRIHLQQS